jgi:hypothetical protein
MPLLLLGYHTLIALGFITQTRTFKGLPPHRGP